MSATATAPTAARPGFDWVVLLFVVAVGGASLVLDFLGNGNLALVLVPVLLAGVLALVWVLPLRYSVAALLFLGAALEAPYESFAMYAFRTPWWVLGTAMLGNLNLVTKISAMKFSGFDLAILYLFIIQIHRRAAGNTIDQQGLSPSARPMRLAAGLSAAAILTWLGWGLSRGGDFSNSLWQLQKLFYMPVLFLLLHGSLRGGRDFGLLGKVLLAAGVYRAALATYIGMTVYDHGEPLQWCTTHADTILFAAAVLLLVVMWNERVPGARHPLAFVALAILISGMVANNRRLVWVSLTEGLIATLLVSPWTPLKRGVVRVLILSAPFLTLYAAAGWNSNAGVFKPVAKLRSVVDSKTDSSSLWRDMENANLVVNVAGTPFFGVGFGHQYIEYEKLPDVSSVYPQYRYIPHNGVLAQFAFAGAFGVTALWSMLLTTVFLAARSYHRARLPRDRVAAMMSINLVFLFLLQVYGDIGVSQWLAPLTIGPAMVIAAKLAIETGAWPRARRLLPFRSSLPEAGT
jgi:O-Antigen ligase